MVFGNSPGHTQIALQKASAGMRKEAAKQEKSLEPSEFDEILPIDHAFILDRDALTGYIDAQDEAEKPVDFAALDHYIYTRQTLAMNKAGMMYDAIDDVDFKPRPGGFVGYLRADQVERHLDDILATGSVDIKDAAPFLSRDFLKSHRAELEQKGLKRPGLVKSLASGVLHKNPYGRLI